MRLSPKSAENVRTLAKIAEFAWFCDKFSDLRIAKSWRDWTVVHVYRKISNKSLIKVLLPAVWSRAPAAIGIGHQPAAQHELLIFLHEHMVVEYNANVMGVEALWALGAADVDPALRDLDAQILSEAVGTRAVVACHDVREAVSGVAQQAQRTLQQLRGGGWGWGGWRWGGSHTGCKKRQGVILLLAHFRLHALHTGNGVHPSSQCKWLAGFGVAATPAEQRAQRDAALFRRLPYRGQTDGWGGGGKVPLGPLLWLMQTHLSRGGTVVFKGLGSFYREGRGGGRGERGKGGQGFQRGAWGVKTWRWTLCKLLPWARQHKLGHTGLFGVTRLDLDLIWEEAETWMSETMEDQWPHLKCILYWF